MRSLAVAQLDVMGGGRGADEFHKLGFMYFEAQGISQSIWWATI